LTQKIFIKKSVFMKPLIIVLISALFVFAACKKSATTSNDTGLSNVSIYLTDDPIVNVDQLLVDIQGVEVKIEDDGVDSLGGWFRLNIRAGVYDILKFRNGIDTLFASGQFPSGRKLQKLRLTLGSNNSVVVNGQNFPLALHNNESTIIVKLEDASVDVVSAGQVRFWIDFDAGRSVRQNGNTFELRSQLKAFSKGKSGSIEGRVSPASAKSTIMAINGTDTAMAMPDGEGEFKIPGLNAGTYQVFIHPTANNYRDTVINNVVVRNSEDAHIGTIQLSR
jgi:hypothetical protein